jgi:hypothetical protein
MALSGVRPQVLGNYTGEDGLRINDLPELTIQDKEVVFEKIPSMVFVGSARALIYLIERSIPNLLLIFIKGFLNPSARKCRKPPSVF